MLTSDVCPISPRSWKILKRMQFKSNAVVTEYFIHKAVFNMGYLSTNRAIFGLHQAI